MLPGASRGVVSGRCGDLPQPHYPPPHRIIYTRATQPRNHTAASPAPLNRFGFFLGCFIQQSSWTCPGFLQWLQILSRPCFPLPRPDAASASPWCELAGMLPELLPFRIPIRRWVSSVNCIIRSSTSISASSFCRKAYVVVIRKF